MKEVNPLNNLTPVFGRITEIRIKGGKNMNIKKNRNIKTVYRGNGNLVVEKFKGGRTLICPDCKKGMEKVFMMHDDNFLFAGYGACMCGRPR